MPVRKDLKLPLVSEPTPTGPGASPSPSVQNNPNTNSNQVPSPWLGEHLTYWRYRSTHVPVIVAHAFIG